jgi:soluble lytic murein transglycosylase-like protein
VKGELAVNRLKLERFAEVASYSSHYRIPNSVAASIYDAAAAAGIDPSLGFQLVNVESRFQPRARSNRGAIGYTQVRLATARAREPGLAEHDLYRPAINLRIGFGVLKDLLRQFDYDLELALRAYNLGPTAAVLSLADPTTDAQGKAYAAKVMRGVRRGRGR